MIRIRNLFYQYPKSSKKVLDGMELTLSPDKINVLLGANGAGKTTFFDAITGSLPGCHAQVSVPRNEILYQTQSVFLSHVITGEDFLRLVYGLGDMPFAKQPERLELFGTLDRSEQELLCHIWKLKLGSLSVGERKWLFVTALSRLQRKLYIFDEPTSAVDPSSRIKIVKRLESLVKQSKTVLMSTHQLHELSTIDCRIFMLHRGKIVFTGTYAEFLNLSHTDNPDQAFEHFLSSSESDQLLADLL